MIRRTQIALVLLSSALLAATMTAAQPPALPTPAPAEERARGLSELRKREPDQARIEHALAVEAIMRELALRAHGNADEWGLAGLLHDVDLSETRDDMRKHGVAGAKLLVTLGFGSSVARAIQAHDDRAGIPRTQPIDFALYCADRAYWAIRSSGLRFPSPEAASATPAGVIERLKSRDISNRIDDKLLQDCAALGLTIDALLRASLHAMHAFHGRAAVSTLAPRA